MIVLKEVFGTSYLNGGRQFGFPDRAEAKTGSIENEAPLEFPVVLDTNFSR